MTAPLRPMLPKGDQHFPDVEKALITLTQDDLLSKLPYGGIACIMLPPAKEVNALTNEGQTLVEIQRAGGYSDRVYDYSRILLRVTTSYRTASQEMMGWLRHQLCDIEPQIVHNPDGTHCHIMGITDSQGQKDTPPPSEDLRTVSGLLTVQTKLNT